MAVVRAVVVGVCYRRNRTLTENDIGSLILARQSWIAALTCGVVRRPIADTLRGTLQAIAVFQITSWIIARHSLIEHLSMWFGEPVHWTASGIRNTITAQFGNRFNHRVCARVIEYSGSVCVPWIPPLLAECEEVPPCYSKYYSRTEKSLDNKTNCQKNHDRELRTRRAISKQQKTTTNYTVVWVLFE